MVKRNFQPGFRCNLHHKDLGILTSAARDAGVVIPLGAATAQLRASLVAQGHGDLDNTALLRLVEQLSGRLTESRSKRSMTRLIVAGVMLWCSEAQGMPCLVAILAICSACFSPRAENKTRGLTGNKKSS